MKTPNLQAEINKARGKGAYAAGLYVKKRIMEKLSAPAPRKRVLSAKGVNYYRATTPAVKGAPPRKLSGRLRSSIAVEKTPEGGVRVGSNVLYAHVHEFGSHPFLVETIEECMPAILEIVGDQITGGIAGALD